MGINGQDNPVPPTPSGRGPAVGRPVRDREIEGSIPSAQTTWNDWMTYLGLFCIFGLFAMASISDRLPQIFPACLGISMGVYLIVSERRLRLKRESRIRSDAEVEFATKARPPSYSGKSGGST